MRSPIWYVAKPGSCLADLASQLLDLLLRASRAIRPLRLRLDHWIIRRRLPRHMPLLVSDQLRRPTNDLRLRSRLSLHRTDPHWRPECSSGQRAHRREVGSSR